ncbi:MAG: Bax inhibitor-1/YccA family protein [Candidatus Eremiobacteraeota bacterium]|nr:Bax inhibitor-1/YccA family protein [Candidatus Eremiobacteraeota bacterium]
MSLYSNEMINLEEAQKALFIKVYGWMAAALALTGLVAWQVASSEEAVKFIIGNSMVFFGLIIGEFLLVIAISWAIKKISATTATVLFFIYAAVNGLTLSVIFLAYTQASIASTFFVTAGTFAVMSAYGYFTKSDLSKWGNILFMALLGLIIASVVNIFFHNSTLYWIITYAGVLIFVGLTAYDTWKIKKMASQMEEGTEAYIKYSILAALMLYLDFINLFLLLLRVMGRRK